MKIHEYQAKKLFSEYGIPVPKGGVAQTPDEAKELAAQIGGKVVLKAQVHAGGRGRAGGIKTASSPDEAERIAQSLIGTRLVTHQTTPEGVPLSSVLVEEAMEAKRELYLGIVNDTSVGMPVMMASEAGGMEIEEIAQKFSEKILRAYLEPEIGFRPFQGRRLAFGMNLEGNQIRQAVEVMSGLYRLFRDKDCTLAEINPFVLTPDGRLLALDAKLNFDDNALFRHRDIAELRDPEQEDPLEVEAKSRGVENYVKMNGNIGIMVNGAGLAMSVMDTIKLAGGEPANFLDIGVLNVPDRVVNAFKILTSDPNVKVILVNIFGGLARVDVIATGIVEAFKQMSIDIPVVVRLAGTNVAEGERILSGSGLNLIRAYDLSEAAQKAVAAAKKIT
jgi:succinyl-CoA synthetase beta subunit